MLAKMHSGLAIMSNALKVSFLIEISSKIQSVNILGRTGTACEAFQPSAGLSPDQVGNVQRYLDAVRSNLLSAKSVLLVEGDAEEILIQVLKR